VTPGRPLRVLVVEDRDDDVVLLLEELRRCGYDVTHGRVETEPTLRLALQHSSWDILISDFSLHHDGARRARHRQPHAAGPAVHRHLGHRR
jgi:response regulator RpfG family c-di-GMP phosphodiesterase